MAKDLINIIVRVRLNIQIRIVVLGSNETHAKENKDTKKFSLKSRKKYLSLKSCKICCGILKPF